MNQKTSGSEKPGPLSRGRPTRREHKKIKSIVVSYYDMPKTYQQISEETGYNIKTIWKYLSPLYKAAREESMKRFIEERSLKS